jgi:hypothetical protein
MSQHEGIFSRGLFDGGSLGDADAAIDPGDRRPIAMLDSLRSHLDIKWPTEHLRQKGITHYSVEPFGGGAKSAGGLRITLYENDRVSSLVPPFLAYRRPSDPVPPVPGGDSTKPVFREGDGLLPAATDASSNGAPKWLPWVLLGGGLLVAGGIVYGASRKPVRANRRRRRRKR